MLRPLLPCDSTHSWQLYSATPLGNEAAGKMASHTELTIHSLPYPILMLSARLGSNDYQIYKSLLSLNWEQNSQSSTDEARVLPTRPRRPLYVYSAYSPWYQHCCCTRMYAYTPTVLRPCPPVPVSPSPPHKIISLYLGKGVCPHTPPSFPRSTHTHHHTPAHTHHQIPYLSPPTVNEGNNALCCPLTQTHSLPAIISHPPHPTAHPTTHQATLTTHQPLRRSLMDAAI